MALAIPCALQQNSRRAWPGGPARVVHRPVFFNEWKALANVQRFDVLIAASAERVTPGHTGAVTVDMTGTERVDAMWRSS